MGLPGARDIHDYEGWKDRLIDLGESFELRDKDNRAVAGGAGQQKNKNKNKKHWENREEEKPNSGAGHVEKKEKESDKPSSSSSKPKTDGNKVNKNKRFNIWDKLNVTVDMVLGNIIIEKENFALTQSN